MGPEDNTLCQRLGLGCLDRSDPQISEAVAKAVDDLENRIRAKKPSGSSNERNSGLC